MPNALHCIASLRSWADTFRKVLIYYTFWLYKHIILGKCSASMFTNHFPRMFWHSDVFPAWHLLVHLFPPLRQQHRLVTQLPLHAHTEFTADLACHLLLKRDACITVISSSCEGSVLFSAGTVTFFMLTSSVPLKCVFMIPAWVYTLYTFDLFLTFTSSTLHGISLSSVLVRSTLWTLSPTVSPTCA